MRPTSRPCGPSLSAFGTTARSSSSCWPRALASTPRGPILPIAGCAWHTCSPPGPRRTTPITLLVSAIPNRWGASASPRPVSASPNAWVAIGLTFTDDASGWPTCCRHERRVSSEACGRAVPLCAPQFGASDAMSEQSATFELSVPGAGDPIRFAFTSGGDRDHIASFVRAHGLASYEAPTPAVFRRFDSGGVGFCPRHRCQHRYLHVSCRCRQPCRERLRVRAARDCAAGDVEERLLQPRDGFPDYRRAFRTVAHARHRTVLRDDQRPGADIDQFVSRAEPRDAGRHPYPVRDHHGDIG